MCTAPFAGSSCSQCQPGQYGADCDVSCSDEMCNGGTCNPTPTTALDMCVCPSGLDSTSFCVGRDCPSKCSGHGNCADGTCLCDAPFTGDVCDQCPENFYGVGCDIECGPNNCLYACSPAGVCLCPAGFNTSDQCNSCLTGYYDEGDCSLHCTASQCGSHGTCSLSSDLPPCACAGNWAGDACTHCQDGFYGADCEVMCVAGEADGSTCIHGTCSSAGACVCSASAELGFWAGADCSACSANYYSGPAGDCTVECVAATTCHGHGTCGADGACECATGFANGDGDAQICNICEQGLYGAACDQKCVGGTYAAGSCTCFNSAIDGHYTGAQCDSCAANYAGDSCEVPCSSPIASAEMAADGTAVIFAFGSAPVTMFDASAAALGGACSTWLTVASGTLTLGDCTFEQSEVGVVIVGLRTDTTTTAVGSVVQVVANAIKLDSPAAACPGGFAVASGSATVASPANLAPLAASVVVTPSPVVGSCATLAAMFEVQADVAVAFSVSWSRLPGLVGKTGASVTLAGADLPSATGSLVEYTATATLADTLGRTLEVNGTFMRVLTLGAPSVQMPPTLSAALGASVSVNAEALYGDCVDLAAVPAATWTWTATPTGLSVDATGPVAFVQTSVSTAAGDYNIEAKACAAGSTTDCATSSTTLTVTAGPMSISAISVPSLVGNAEAIPFTATVIDGVDPRRDMAAFLAGTPPVGTTVTWGCQLVSGTAQAACPVELTAALATASAARQLSGSIPAPTAGWRDVVGVKQVQLQLTVEMPSRITASAVSATLVSVSRIRVVPGLILITRRVLRQNARARAVCAFSAPQPEVVAAYVFDVLDANGAVVTYPGTNTSLLDALGIFPVRTTAGAAVTMRQAELAPFLQSGLIRCTALFGSANPDRATGRAVAAAALNVAVPPFCRASSCLSTTSLVEGALGQLIASRAWGADKGRGQLTATFTIVLAGAVQKITAQAGEKRVSFVPWAAGQAEITLAIADDDSFGSMTITRNVASSSTVPGSMVQARDTAQRGLDLATASLFSSALLLRQQLGLRRASTYNVSDCVAAVSLAYSQLTTQFSSATLRRSVLAGGLATALNSAVAASVVVPADALAQAMETIRIAAAGMGGTAFGSFGVENAGSPEQVSGVVAAGAALVNAWAVAGNATATAQASATVNTHITTALAAASRAAPQGTLGAGSGAAPTPADEAAAAAREMVTLASGLPGSALVAQVVSAAAPGSNVTVVVSAGAFNTTDNAVLSAIIWRGTLAGRMALGATLAGPAVQVSLRAVTGGGSTLGALPLTAAGSATGTVRVTFQAGTVAVTAQCAVRNAATGLWEQGASGVKAERNYAQRRVDSCIIPASLLAAGPVMVAPVTAVCDPASMCSGNGTCSAATTGDLCMCATGRNATDGCATCVSKYGPEGTCGSTCFNFNTTTVCSGHGTCVNFKCTCDTNSTIWRYGGDVCETCAPGYWGSQCLECPQKCGSHGSCSAATGACMCQDRFAGADCLSCAAGWYGAQCNIACTVAANCSGVVGAQCSQQGTCTCKPGYSTASNCTACEPGLVGASCNVVCPGPSKSAACNLRGTCSLSATNSSAADCACEVNFDAAAACGQCLPGWSGVNCTIQSSCVGPASCNNHGACSGLTGKCVCDFSLAKGYYGGDSCAACAADYYGANCTVPCSNVTCASPGGVCGATGCACQPGHVGARCELCAAGMYRDPATQLCSKRCVANETCSDHGACVANNVTGVSCVCTQSATLGYYAGDTCAACKDGYRKNDAGICVLPCSLVGDCSGHGVCASGGNRTCACYGEAAANTPASMGSWTRAAGSSVDCGVCAGTMVGAACNLTCAEGCNAAGTTGCAAGQCQCAQSAVRGFWTGARCDACSPGYAGPQCAVSCSNTTTCSGHGTCASSTSAATVCTCATGWSTEAVGGVFCAKCAASYYPDGQCTTMCDAATTCSGNGVCGPSGACVCSPTRAGPSCSVCAAGWGGAACNIPTGVTGCTADNAPTAAVVASAQLAAAGDEVLVRFSADTNQAGRSVGSEVACSTLLISASPAWAGATTCVIDSPSAVRVRLAAGSAAFVNAALSASGAVVTVATPATTLTAAQQISTAVFLSGPAAASPVCGAPAGGSAMVTVPQLGLDAPEVVAVDTPSTPSGCDDIVYTARVRCAGGACTFAWSAAYSGGAVPAGVASAMAASTNSSVTLGSSLVGSLSGTLTVTVRATESIALARFATASATTTLAGGATKPRLTLPPAVTVPYGAAVAIEASAAPTACGSGSATGGTWAWACTGGVSTAGVASAATGRLELPWATVSAASPNPFVCTVTATLPGHTAAATAEVPVTLAPQPLRAAVTPAMTEVSTTASPSSATFTAAGDGCGGATDACTYAWSVCRDDGATAAATPCPDGSLLNVPSALTPVSGASTKAVTAAVSGAAPAAAGRYRIVATVRRGSAVSEVVGAFLLVVTGTPANAVGKATVASGSGAVATAGTPMRFSATLVDATITGTVTWVWAIAPPVATSAMRAAGPELTLLAGAVATGTHSLTVTARAQVAGADVAVGTTTVLVNAPPSAVVAPRVVGGPAVSEAATLTLQTAQEDWQDDDPDAGVSAAPLTWRWVAAWGTDTLQSAFVLSPVGTTATRSVLVPPVPTGVVAPAQLRVFAIAVDRFGAEGAAAAATTLSVSLATDPATVVTTVLTSTSFTFAAAATAAPLVERVQASGATTSAATSATTLLGKLVDLINLPRAGALGADDARNAIVAAAATLRVLQANGNMTAATVASVQRVVAESVGSFSADAAAAPAQLMRVADGQALLDMLVAVAAAASSNSATAYTTQMDTVMRAVSATVEVSGTIFSHRSGAFGFFAATSLDAAGLSAGPFRATGAGVGGLRIPAAAAAVIAPSGRRVRVVVRTTGVRVQRLLAAAALEARSALVSAEVVSTTGAVVPVSGLAIGSPLVLEVPGASGLAVGTVQCAVWRESLSVWEVATDSNFAVAASMSADVMECRSTHLSTFAVVNAPDSASAPDSGSNQMLLLLLLLLLIPIIILIIVIICCCCRGKKHSQEVSPADASDPVKDHPPVVVAGADAAARSGAGAGAGAGTGAGGQAAAAYAMPPQTYPTPVAAASVGYAGEPHVVMETLIAQDEDWPPAIAVNLTGMRRDE